MPRAVVRYCCGEEARFDGVLKLVVENVEEIAPRADAEEVRTYCRSVLYYEGKLFEKK